MSLNGIFRQSNWWFWWYFGSWNEICLSKDQSCVLSIIDQPTKLCNFALLLPVPAQQYGVGYNMWNIDLLVLICAVSGFFPPVYKVGHWLEELFLVDSSSFCWYIVDLCLFASEVGLRIVLQKGGVTKKEKSVETSKKNIWVDSAYAIPGSWLSLKLTSGTTVSSCSTENPTEEQKMSADPDKVGHDQIIHSNGAFKH